MPASLHYLSPDQSHFWSSRRHPFCLSVHQPCPDQLGDDGLTEARGSVQVTLQRIPWTRRDAVFARLEAAV